MERAISILQKLGLTMVQAKVLTALAANGNLSVNQLSKFSKVHRTDVYRVLKELEKKGFVERIIGNPTLYRAIQLEDSINILLKSRVTETKQLLKEAHKLHLDLKKELSRKKVIRESKFILVPAKLVIKKIASVVDRTQKSADLIITSTRFVRGMLTFSEAMEKSWRRGVKWRIAIHMQEESNAFWERVEFCRKNCLCQIRFIGNPTLDVIGVYDQEEVFIIENPKMGLAESSALWSNNPGLIFITRDHFERVWRKGTKHWHQKP